MEKTFERHSELIRLFVKPQIITDQEFHEVTPGQLEEYLNEQKVSKSEPQHRRNRYYELAIMAKVDSHTTNAELERLLKNDVRTLIVQKNYNKPQDLEQIFLKINSCLDKFYKEQLHRTPIGVVVEVNGELLITGRMRNDQSVFLEKGQIIVFSNNEEYRNCSFKEVVYVSNLWRYTNVLSLGDVIVMGTRSEIVAEVVKCDSMWPIEVKVTKPGLLLSFMTLKLPCYVEAKELNEKDLTDIDDAIKYEPHFLLIPGIRSVAFLRAIKEHIANADSDVNRGVRLIGSIDFEYLESKFIDIADYLMELDGVVVNHMFRPYSQNLLTHAIAQVKKHNKPLIGCVPLKTCKDFKKLENHTRIKQIDCLLIEKSPLQMKFPLIAKKLLPVGNRSLDISLLNSSSCKEGIVNFVLRMIYSIPCQGLVVTNSCPKAAEIFSNPQIYCPVVVVVDSDQIAHPLNLRRNLKTIVCPEKNRSMDVGIEFARKQGIFKTGDFIIALSDSMEEDSRVCVNLRAYFLPPMMHELLS